LNARKLEKHATLARAFVNTSVSGGAIILRLRSKTSIHTRAYCLSITIYPIMVDGITLTLGFCMKANNWDPLTGVRGNKSILISISHCITPVEHIHRQICVKSNADCKHEDSGKTILTMIVGMPNTGKSMASDDVAQKLRAVAAVNTI